MRRSAAEEALRMAVFLTLRAAEEVEALYRERLSSPSTGISSSIRLRLMATRGSSCICNRRCAEGAAQAGASEEARAPSAAGHYDAAHALFHGPRCIVATTRKEGSNDDGPLSARLK
jgi:hypothetical protein